MLRFCKLHFFSSKFVGTVFVLSYDLASTSSFYDSLILSYIIAESYITVAKYFSFSQLYVVGLRT